MSAWWPRVLPWRREQPVPYTPREPVTVADWSDIAVTEEDRKALGEAFRKLHASSATHNAPPVADRKSATRRPCRYCPDPLCPEDCPECGSPIHDLDAVPALQRTRADNAEERLRLAREALIRDGYFTADEIGDDIAPRLVEWLAHHGQQLEQAQADARSLGASVHDWAKLAAHHQHWGQRRLNAWKSARARAARHREHAKHAEAEVARLRAGEEPGWDPAVAPTPGQWIARWNRASAAERLDVAQRVIWNAQKAGECFEMNHAARLEDDREARAALARVRELRDRWLLMTLEPGQVRRLLDEIAFALEGQRQDGIVCDAYRPPATPADSGLCARCGMSDYKHPEATSA